VDSVAFDLPAFAAHTKIPHGTLRYWASRYKWQPVGKDSRGRKLYARDMLLAHPAIHAMAAAEAARHP
jgi:DNA-binding transcriptional MerR regulator